MRRKIQKIKWTLSNHCFILLPHILCGIYSKLQSWQLIWGSSGWDNRTKLRVITFGHTIYKKSRENLPRKYFERFYEFFHVSPPLIMWFGVVPGEIIERKSGWLLVDVQYATINKKFGPHGILKDFMNFFHVSPPLIMWFGVVPGEIIERNLRWLLSDVQCARIKKKIGTQNIRKNFTILLNISPSFDSWFGVVPGEIIERNSGWLLLDIQYTRKERKICPESILKDFMNFSLFHPLLSCSLG